MRLHGGSLEIESKVNVGTVVTILFPINRQEEDKIAAD